LAGRQIEDFTALASDWFWEMDENLRFSYFSSSLKQTIGVEPEQEIGKSRYDIAANAQDKAFWQAHFETLERQETFRNLVYPYRHEDGRVQWLCISGKPFYDEDGTFKGYRGVGSDVTAEHEARQQLDRALDELRTANAALEKQNILFETAIDTISQGLCMFDPDGRLIACNRRYGEMYSLPEALMQPGTPLKDILTHRIAAGLYAGNDPEAFMTERLRMVSSVVRIERIDELRDGRAYLIAHAQLPVGGSVAIHEDITERKRAEERIAHMARHDALTGLPNRLFLRDTMEEALARPSDGDGEGEGGGDGGFAVLCLDLDDFKAVNDSLGHPAGDVLLQAVTRRLQVCVRDDDMISRLGGDEFAILQPGPDNRERAATLARRIIEVLNAAFTIDGQQVVVGASIGIAVAPRDGTEPDQLLKNADLALYRAKDDGRRTYRFFENEMDMRQRSRRVLEMDLRRALVNGEFELFYQPIVSLASGEISGVEALLRWRHPERGLRPPGEFIPLCEEIGLIVPLGDWVLRTACRQVAQMSDDITIAINLSPAQFKNPGLVSSVMQALTQAGLEPGRLELEITESVLLLESEETLAALHQLRDLGVRISMDDFGTGYSSLSYLRRFPFDRIKIDRSFTADLDKKGDCLAIVRAVAGLGADLGIDTTAEGVETETQLKALRKEGLTEVQGFLFSPPVPHDEIRKILAGSDKTVFAA